MKSSCSVLLLLLCSVLINSRCQNAIEVHTSELPVVEGPYLGMPLPGDVPEIFAPGIVSNVYDEHSGAVFTPDGKELFWTTVINEGRTPRIVIVLHMTQEDDKWNWPEAAPFNRGSYTHINSISPDGQRLYFFSDGGDGLYNARVIDKTDNSWGTPRLLQEHTEDQPASVVNEVHEARSENLYMSGPLPSMPGGRGIVRSRIAGGTFLRFESLGPEVNSPHSDRFPNHSPTIDPDEQFVIFASTRPGGFSEQDLYISYRRSDDSWSPAVNLGPKINGFGARSSWPQLSPDGNFLFFVSTVRTYRDIDERQYSYAEMKEIQESVMNGWSNIYWVDTSFVERLRPLDLE